MLSIIRGLDRVANREAPQELRDVVDITTGVLDEVGGILTVPEGTTNIETKERKVLTTKIHCDRCGRNNDPAKEVCSSCGCPLQHHVPEAVVRVYEDEVSP
jgi:ribosomal protein L37E